jgi:hypothetical protein
VCGSELDRKMQTETNVIARLKLCNAGFQSSADV